VGRSGRGIRARSRERARREPAPLLPEGAEQLEGEARVGGCDDAGGEGAVVDQPPPVGRAGVDAEEPLCAATAARAGLRDLKTRYQSPNAMIPAASVHSPASVSTRSAPAPTVARSASRRSWAAEERRGPVTHRTGPPRASRSTCSPWTRPIAAWSVLTVPRGEDRSHEDAAASTSGPQAFRSTSPARPASSRSRKRIVERLEGSVTTASGGAGSRKTARLSSISLPRCERRMLPRFGGRRPRW
jgi:hypothetical protein